MEFLEKLYEIENFGIYLFVVIGVLIVMFLVVLFFGKKDSEKVLKEKEAFKDIEREVPLEVEKVEEPVIPAPVEASIDKEVKPVITNQVLNEEVKLEDNKPEEVVQEKEFDFDALAAAISKELDSIDNRPSQKEVSTPVVEEPIKPVIEEKEEVLAPLFEPVREDSHVKEVYEKEENVVKTRPVMPEVFSSVYVNREKETPNTFEKEEVVKPVKPVMDLPKKMELPKRVK